VATKIVVKAPNPANTGQLAGAKVFFVQRTQFDGKFETGLYHRGK
jgi:hypothetical protein